MWFMSRVQTCTLYHKMIVQSRLAHERLLARRALVRLGVPGDMPRVVLLIRIALPTFDALETGRGETFTEPVVYVRAAVRSDSPFFHLTFVRHARVPLQCVSNECVSDTELSIAHGARVLVGTMCALVLCQSCVHMYEDLTTHPPTRRRADNFRTECTLECAYVIRLLFINCNSK
jgi:hypothetical protein